MTLRQEHAPTYRCWMQMRRRCRDAKGPRAASYIGRGIAVCARWSSFANFLDDMGPRPSPQHTLDRVNVNGAYSPNNCRWATQTEQQRNRTNNLRIRAFGYNRTLVEWSEATGLAPSTVQKRLRMGWTAEQAVGLKENPRRLGDTCRSGHSLSGANVKPRGLYRACRQCAIDRDRANRIRALKERP